MFPDFDISYVPQPREVGLPHDVWRHSQLDAFLKVREIHNNTGGNVVIEAPVGVGKSAIPTALGAVDQVLVIVSNHGLLNQYEAIYGFDIIKGKQEYPCVLESKINSWAKKYNISPTASDCHFVEMYECPVSHQCPYLLAKRKALESKRAACTYKYAALSQPIQEREGIVVMDEAHNVVEDLLGTSAFEMVDSTRQDYKFDPFPLPDYGKNGKGDLLNTESKTKILTWLQSCLNKVAIFDLFDMASPNGAKNKKMFERINEAVSFVLNTEFIFYTCNFTDDDQDWRKYKTKRKSEVRMSMRSLFVQPIAQKIIGPKKTRIFMSATIGNPNPLMAQVGVGEFAFFGYPHPVQIDKRPIYDLGIEKMTKHNIDSKPSLYKDQAMAIAKFIKTLPTSWRGIVLTSSNYKVSLLRRFLADELEDRVFVQDEFAGLGDRVSSFIRDDTPGKISIDTIQGWGSGISLDGDIARFSIVAGVPFVNPSDRFEELRMSNDIGRKYGWWKPFSDVAQATGRVTRGERDESGEYLLNVAALADGSATSNLAMSQYPVWMKKAIRKG